MIKPSNPVEERQRAEHDVFEVAAYWHGLFEDGEPKPQERDRFEAWLAAAPHNRSAYESIERSWAATEKAGLDERILIMRRDALAAPKNAPVPWNRPSAIAASIVVAIALIAGILFRYGPLGAGSSAGVFATQVGERSNVSLADGSTIVLNTASRVQVAFDRERRVVRLLCGQAWFEVAKNQSRPFIVEAGGHVVTAHGTAFDVRLEDHDGVQVTLMEGRVSVEKADNGELNVSVEREDLLPGDQLIVTATRPPTKRKADVAKATSWRESQIIFDDDTLADAIAEVNRYSARKIVLADPRLATLRMSGVFIAGHNDSFLETVTANFPVKLISDANGQFVLTAAD